MSFCGDLFQIEKGKNILFLACVKDKDHRRFHHSAVLEQEEGMLARIEWGDRERWEEEKRNDATNRRIDFGYETQRNLQRHEAQGMA